MAGELFMARWMASLVASWLYLTILALSSAGGWMKKDAANDHQLVGRGCGNRPLGDAIGNGLGHGVLGGNEHLHGLLHRNPRQFSENCLRFPENPVVPELSRWFNDSCTEAIGGAEIAS